MTTPGRPPLPGSARIGAPPSTTGVSPSNYTPGPNAWPGWDLMVLADLGAKPTRDNLWFLDSWQLTEYSKAKNNPLNLTAPPGVSQFASSSGAKIQTYATEREGALYTANNIKSLYPTIHQMLVEPNGVNDVLFNNKYGGPQNLIQELKDWGSVSFANQLSPGSVPAGAAAGNAVAGLFKAPFKDIAGAITWIGNNWPRILIFIGGFLAVVIGGFFVFRAQSGGDETVIAPKFIAME